LGHLGLKKGTALRLSLFYFITRIDWQIGSDSKMDEWHIIFKNRFQNYSVTEFIRNYNGGLIEEGVRKSIVEFLSMLPEPPLERGDEYFREKWAGFLSAIEVCQQGRNGLAKEMRLNTTGLQTLK
jgi:hypothetical protein